MWTLTCQLQWIITYWIIITTVVIELLYVYKFCYNKEPGLLLWEYNRVILAQSANTGFITGYYSGYNTWYISLDNRYTTGDTVGYTTGYFSKYTCRVTEIDIIIGHYWIFSFPLLNYIQHVWFKRSYQYNATAVGATMERA